MNIKQTSMARRGLWICVLALTAVVMLAVPAQECRAQCAPDIEPDCDELWEQRWIYAYMSAGCYLRVHYKVRECNGPCQIEIDSIIVPSPLESCDHCLAYPALSMKQIMDEVQAQIMARGMWNTPCGDCPPPIVRTYKPDCWALDQYIQGQDARGNPIAQWTFLPCGEEPCCETTWIVDCNIPGGVSSVTPIPGILLSSPVDCQLATPPPGSNAQCQKTCQ